MKPQGPAKFPSDSTSKMFASQKLLSTCTTSRKPTVCPFTSTNRCSFGDDWVVIGLTPKGAGTLASNRPIPSCVQSTSELLPWNSSSLSSYLPDLASSMWWPTTFVSRVRVGSSKLVAKNPLTRSSCSSSTCQRWSPTGVVDDAGFHTSKKLPACGPSWYGRSIGFPPLNV